MNKTIIALIASLLAVATAHADINPVLQRELLQMEEQDQAVRTANPIDMEKFSAVDRANTQRLKEIIAQHGWPSISKVGKPGARAAWLLAQHADEDRDFQRAVLAMLEKLPPGEVEPRNIAYLHDRVTTPQRYGTQGSCNDAGQWVAFEVEDPAGLDQRRASVGLGPQAEYVTKVNQYCSRTAP